MRVSWALHNLADDDFDPSKVLDLLGSKNLFEWSSMHICAPSTDKDPLETITGLLQLYTEVDLATDLVAQGMNAATETIVHPHVEVTPISLSSMERTRIACSLYILKIYYQFRLKFIYAGHGSASKFPSVFSTALKPWQAEQVLSVEWYFLGCQDPTPYTMYKAADGKFTCQQCMFETSLYFRNFKRALDLHSDSMTRYLGIPMDFTRYMFQYHHTLTAGQSWRRNSSDVGRPSRMLPLTTAFKNHGWTLLKLAVADRVSRPVPLRRLIHLGLLFWNHDRLTDLDLVDTGDILALYAGMPRHAQQMKNGWPVKWGRICLDHRGHRRVKKSKIGLLLEWTRCPVQCTLEEFGYQQAILDICAKARPPSHVQ